MNKLLKYTLLTLMWAAVAAYILFAAAEARRIRHASCIGRVVVEAADSSAQGHLVTGAAVRRWIDRAGIATLGEPVDEVDLTAIEQLVAGNGFVKRVVACVQAPATLRITVRRRKPVVRLRTDGIDSYATHEGFVFTAPKGSSLYVPVVTGPYRPPFAADYSGDVLLAVSERIAAVEERIAELERSKYPVYRRERQNDRNIAEVRRMRTSRRWWRLERAETFEKRVEELREQKALLRRRYRYEARLIQQELERIAAEQEAQRRAQKNLEKSYEDFMKLLTFVEYIEDDDFWRSEVVQIIARTAPGGALEVDLIPRSGAFTVRFGRIEQVDRKLDKLMRFYRDGLTSIGWSRYRSVDIRYAGQVICRE